MQLGPLVKLNWVPPSSRPRRFNLLLPATKTNTVNWWEAVEERSQWSFPWRSLWEFPQTFPTGAAWSVQSPVSGKDSWVQWVQLLATVCSVSNSDRLHGVIFRFFFYTKGHFFTHETESPWPLHFKHSHWWWKGGSGPSSLHTTLEGPTEYVIASWM